MKGDDYDSDLVNDLNEQKRDAVDSLQEVMKDLRENIKELEITDPELSISSGSHTSEENLLYKLINFKNGILLNFVLSSDEIDKINTEALTYNLFNVDSKIKTLSIDKVLLSEYELQKFHFYNKDKYIIRNPIIKCRFKINNLQ